MTCANPEPEILEELVKTKVIRKYDTSPELREKHDQEMEKWRKEQARKRVHVQPKLLKLTLKTRMACFHPKTQRVLEETYTREFEVVPPCPHCHANASLIFEEFYLTNRMGVKTKLIQTYRCRECNRTVSLNRYEELKKKTFMACSKCKGKVEPQQAYPYILECVNCHEVFPPERKEELLNVKIIYWPQSIIGTDVYSDQDIIDGDLYKCPIYGGTKRPRWDEKCKAWCGYRDEKNVENTTMESI